jgi:Aldehyde dehydrogenase family
MLIENIINNQTRPAQRRADNGSWELPETSEHDVQLAIKSRHARVPQRLPEVIAILAAIGREGSWITDAQLLDIAVRSGSPIKYLRHSVDRFNAWLADLRNYVASLGEVDASGRLVRDGMAYSGGLATAMVLAGDEVTLAPWTITHALLADASVIAKPSSIEPLSAFLFVRELIRRGARAPSLLAFDSNREDDRARVQRIITHADQSVVFGEDDTIRRIYGALPFLPRHKAIPYWSGRSGSVVYPDADVDLVASAVIAGATEDRGNRCISTKKVFAPRAMAEALEARLTRAANDLVRGDPADPATDIGTNEPGARSRAEAASGGSDVFYDAHLMIARCDDFSDLVCNEAPYPAIGLRYYESDEDPVAIANRAVQHAPSGRALVMSVFTRSAATFHRAAMELHACKTLHNQPTSHWDPFSTHQAMHLCLELMRKTEYRKGSAAGR